MLPGLSPQDSGKPLLRGWSAQSIKDNTQGNGRRSKTPLRIPSTQSMKDNTKANGHTNPRPQFRRRNNERRCPHAQQKPAATCGMHQRSLRLRALLPDHSRCGAVRHGVQACPAPTAILSKHTGFPHFTFQDFTPHLGAYLADWGELEFDAVYTGFLGSAEQIRLVEDFLAQQRARQHTPPHVIIDTVMGDGGKLYPTYTPDMCRRMKRLVSHADVITPNITEACILTGMDYPGEELSTAQARALACRLYDLGAGAVVITGIVREPVLCNLVYDGRELYFDAEDRTERMFSGTGDLFASIVSARLAAGGTLPEAVTLAGSFIAAATRYTLSLGTPTQEGVCFEPCLSRLAPGQDVKE